MEIVLKSIENIPVLFLKGRLDALGAKELENELVQSITQKSKTLIIDFQQVDYLSSAGIRIILSLHKKLKKEGGSLKLISLSSLPLQVLEITGLTDVFSINANLKEALNDLAKLKKSEKIISQWDRLPKHKIDNGVYTFLQGKEFPTYLELSGNISDVLHARCSKDDVSVKSFSGNEYSMGLGALGKNIQNCLEVIGEMISLKGIIAWLPIKNPDTPDFLIVRKDKQKITGHYLFDVTLKGEFNQIVSLETKDRRRGIEIGSVYSSLFKICREQYPDFKGILGSVMLAKVSKLYSGGIKEIPLNPAAFPKNMANKDQHWIEDTSQDKPEYRDVTALVVGMGIDLETDLSFYDSNTLNSLFYLHPLNTKGREYLLHNHGIIFPSRDIFLKGADLENEISKIIQSEKFVDVRHLLDTTTVSETLMGLFFIQEIHRKKEKSLIIKMNGKEQQLSKSHSLIARKLFADSKEIELYPLGGGFSGSRVFKVSSWDNQGRKQIPMVMKIGSLEEVQREIEAFEKYVKKFILNNATNLFDWVIHKKEGGLVYNFVGLSGTDPQIFSFDEFYRSHSVDEIVPILNTVFHNILKPWYRQPIYSDLSLYEEYNFAKHLPLIIDCVKEEFSIDDSKKWVKFSEIEKIFINPLYVLKNSFPERLDKKFSSYQSIVHGDLNLRNILLDNKNNIWIIDFSETHQGHILKDLVKLEATIKFESFSVRGWDELKSMLKFEEEILKPKEFKQIPQITFSLKNPWMEKIYCMIQKIREIANEVTLLEEDTSQYYLALLYFTIQVLRYPQISEFTKRYALFSASLICDKL